MYRISTALTYCEWALEFMAVFPICIITLLAAASLVWAAQKQHPFKDGLWRRHHWLALTHFLFFPFAILIGVVWENPAATWGIPHVPNPMASRLLSCVFYGSLLSCVFWAWRMKGFRWYAVSLLTLVELPIYGAIFVAGMAISGEWL